MKRSKQSPIFLLAEVTRLLSSTFFFSSARTPCPYLVSGTCFRPYTGRLENPPHSTLKSLSGHRPWKSKEKSFSSSQCSKNPYTINTKKKMETFWHGRALACPLNASSNRSYKAEGSLMIGEKNTDIKAEGSLMIGEKIQIKLAPSTLPGFAAGCVCLPKHHLFL